MEKGRFVVNKGISKLLQVINACRLLQIIDACRGVAEGGAGGLVSPTFWSEGGGT